MIQGHEVQRVRGRGRRKRRGAATDRRGGLPGCDLSDLPFQRVITIIIVIIIIIIIIIIMECSAERASRRPRADGEAASARESKARTPPLELCCVSVYQTAGTGT